MEEEEAEKLAEKAALAVLSGGDPDDLGPDGVVDAAYDAYLEIMAKFSDD